MTSSQKLENSKKVTFKMLIGNKRVMMASISSVISMVFMLFYDTILSDQLLDIGVNKNLIGIKSIFRLIILGYLFGLICLIYTISSIFVGWLCNKIPKIFIT
jgi:hypothetical protein